MRISDRRTLTMPDVAVVRSRPTWSIHVAGIAACGFSLLAFFAQDWAFRLGPIDIKYIFLGVMLLSVSLIPRAERYIATQPSQAFLTAFGISITFGLLSTLTSPSEGVEPDQLIRWYVGLTVIASMVVLCRCGWQDRVVTAILIGGVPFVLAALGLNILGGDRVLVLATSQGDRATGMYENPNALAGALCVLIPIALYKMSRTRLSLVRASLVGYLVLTVLGVWLSDSRSGLIVAGFQLMAAGILFFKRHKAIVIVGLLLLTIALSWYGLDWLNFLEGHRLLKEGQDVGTHARVGRFLSLVYGRGWEVAVLGFGAGSSQTFFHDPALLPGFMSHVFVEYIWIEWGLVALLITAFAFYRALRHVICRRKQSPVGTLVLMIGVIGSLLQFQAHMSITGVHWLLIGLYLGEACRIDLSLRHQRNKYDLI